MTTMNTRQPSRSRRSTSNAPRTHEGAVAATDLTIEQQLQRTVCSCFLWESEFYESGKAIADRIVELVADAPAPLVTRLAVEARHKMHLRRVPLLLLAALASERRPAGEVLAPEITRRVLGDAIEKIISRPDEITEFLAIYCKLYGIEPNKLKGRLANQVKKGLGRAFAKFDAYQLAKYVSPSAESGRPIRARDIMFLTHPKASARHQETVGPLFHNLANKKAIIAGGADTWETALISGEKGQSSATAKQTKRETFERLIKEGRLGYLALLRNLRGMVEAGVDPEVIRMGILLRKGAENVLPFRYVAAARACPQFEPQLDEALSEAINGLPLLFGQTVVLVDVSRSMFDAKLSEKSDMTRFDAGAALASLVHGNVRMFSFSDHLVEVPPRRGMAGVDALRGSQPHSGTRLFDALDQINREIKYDRIIVVTDEQSHPSGPRFRHLEQSTLDSCPDPVGGRGYMVNVASAQNGVGYGPWVHLDGFSEQIFRFIAEVEKLDIR